MPPTGVVLRKVAEAALLEDEGGVVASEGDDLELECEGLGGSPPPSLTWWLDGERIDGPGRVEAAAPGVGGGGGKRTSRLVLPVSRADHGRSVACRAGHPTLEEELDTAVTLDIHCE